VEIRLETRRVAPSLLDDRPDDLLGNTHSLVAGEELDQGLLGGGLRLGQQVQVTEPAFIPSDRVVIDHSSKLAGHIGTAAPAVLDDGAHLLIAQSDVGAVTSTVVDVVDHMRRLGAPWDVNEQAAPARPIGVGDLMAAHHQRRSNLVASDLVDAVSQLGQLDSAHLAGAAVVVFDPDNQQPAVDSQGREILGQLRVVRSFAGR